MEHKRFIAAGLTLTASIRIPGLVEDFFLRKLWWSANDLIHVGASMGNRVCQAVYDMVIKPDQVSGLGLVGYENVVRDLLLRMGGEGGWETLGGTLRARFGLCHERYVSV
jgi:hypothetical protein